MNERSGNQVTLVDVHPYLTLPCLQVVAKNSVGDTGVVDPGNGGEDSAAKLLTSELVILPQGNRVTLVYRHQEDVVCKRYFWKKLIIVIFEYTSVFGAELLPGIMESKELLLPILLQPPDLLPDLAEELGQGLGGVRHSHLDKGRLLHQSFSCFNIPESRHQEQISPNRNKLSEQYDQKITLCRLMSIYLVT